MQIKRALLSVYDKTGLLELARVLQESQVEIISSGGTAAYLQTNGIQVKTVESVTKFPEMLGGRVKTLNPKIHGGILYLRNQSSHEQECQQAGINPIDLVVVNLYPFSQAVQQPSLSKEEVIEQIDIGGPSLLRSAAKNHQFVTVLSDPSQYKEFSRKFMQNSLTPADLQRYAWEAFRKTASYDQIISNYLSEQDLPNNLLLKTETDLRYGENPHQKAKLYTIEGLTGSMSGFAQIAGKELSFNNWLDIEAAYGLINEFEPELPACAIFKHNIPCGIALGSNTTEAYEYALESDPVSAFGGIAIVNQMVEAETASKMNQMFLEVIIAPSFSEEAISLLTRKKSLRLVILPMQNKITPHSQYKTILGNGLLCQESDNSLFDHSEMRVVTKTEPDSDTWLELLFAFRIVKHIKSNGIALVHGNRSVGICGGQTNRVSAVRIALEQASDLATNSILSSDGFFPFADSVELAAIARIKAIIQPGGSIRDPEVIEMADKYNIPMVFTGRRHFKH